MLTLSLLIVPETYAPTLLRRKAARLQKAADEAGTGEVFIAKFDRVKKPPAQVLRTNLVRPFELLCRELIAACLAIYGAVIYGTLYLFFEAFPIVFTENRGWSLSFSGLSFLGIGVGLVLGSILTPFFNKYYDRAAAKAAAQGVPTPPEARLVGCAVGATCLPIGLFVFAWTSTPNVHWIVPILASVPFGMGFLLIFTGMQVSLATAWAWGMLTRQALPNRRVPAVRGLGARLVSGAAFSGGRRVPIIHEVHVHQSRAQLGRHV